MNKILLATALAVATVSAAQIQCIAQVTAASAVDSCTDSGTAIATDVDASMFTNPLIVVALTVGSEICNDANTSTDPTISGCATALQLIELNGAQLACLTNGKSTNALCPALDGDVCIPSQTGDAGSYCQAGFVCDATDKKCVVAPTEQVVICPADAVVTTTTMCPDYAVVDATPAGNIMTPATQFFTKFTITTAVAPTCTNIPAACKTETKITGVASTADQEKCLVDGAIAGASVACGAAKGTSCDGAICAPGLICGATSLLCEDEPVFDFSITCVVTEKTGATPPPACSPAYTKVVDATPAAIMTPATQFFTTFTVSAPQDPKLTCANIVPACATAIKLADPSTPTADQEKCLVDGATAGASLACGAAKDATCSDTIVCVADLVCDATSKKCGDKVVPPTTVDYTISGVTETDQTKLQAQLDKVFVKATPPAPFIALEDPVNPCAGVTSKVKKIYPAQELAFVELSGAPPADCTSSEQIKSIGTFTKSSADQSTCATACGADACKCEDGMACTPASEGPPVVKDNCVDGQVCTKQSDNTFMCNNSVIASAAFAVAAAVLAVMF